MLDLPSSFVIKEYIQKLQSYPVKCHIRHDNSPAWEMDQFSILELENGKFATVHDNGCSCYDYTDAAIEILPTLELAMDKYKIWKRERSIV